jgi:hypothetical protein
VEKHLELLGFKVRDRVTGFAGVVSSISFDLYGCVQAIVTPEVDKAGKVGESCWFDVKRLERQSKAPVMDIPDFDEVPGPQSKPAYPSQSLK